MRDYPTLNDAKTNWDIGIDYEELGELFGISVNLAHAMYNAGLRTPNDAEAHDAINTVYRLLQKEQHDDAKRLTRKIISHIRGTQ